MFNSLHSYSYSFSDSAPMSVLQAVWSAQNSGAIEICAAKLLRLQQIKEYPL